MSDRTGDITRLLRLTNAGEVGAEERLFRLVYDQLKSLAAGKLGGAGRRTLTPTALVHEAYLRILRETRLPLENRKHLFFAYGRAMCRIVAEHYRRKHGRRIGLDPGELASPAPAPVEQFLDLGDALEALRREYPREYEVAILRKAFGFSIEKTAQLLAVSPATVKRDWAFAKARLSLHLRGKDGERRAKKGRD